MSGNRLAALVIGAFLLVLGLQMLLAGAGLVPVAGSQAAMPAAARLAIGAIALLAGLIIAGLAWRRQARESRLKSRGIGVAGTVVAITKNAIHVNHQPRWTLTYRFVDGSGAVREAQATLSDREVAERLAPGAPLVIHHDAGNPADSFVSDYLPRTAIHPGR